MIRTLMPSVGAPATATVVVGDSIATDIPGAAALGLYRVYSSPAARGFTQRP